jgi:hypothetical protein
MKDKVTLTLNQLCTVARVCKKRKPELLSLLGGQQVSNTLDFTGEVILATLTLGRTQAKLIQTCILNAAQDEAISRADYITINDAFRNAYDETLRRQCGEA